MNGFRVIFPLVVTLLYMHCAHHIIKRVLLMGFTKPTCIPLKTIFPLCGFKINYFLLNIVIFPMGK